MIWTTLSNQTTKWLTWNTSDGWRSSRNVWKSVKNRMDVWCSEIHIVSVERLAPSVTTYWITSSFFCMSNRMIPLEIQDYIFEFIQPYLTREDWRTCRLEESKTIQELLTLLKFGKPRNNSWGIQYKDWSFYEKLRFSTIEQDQWIVLFPCNHLMFCHRRR
jgi:hypothetical protein